MAQVQEKERLRKDMETKIREAKESFMKLTDSQLEYPPPCQTLNYMSYNPMQKLLQCNI